VLVACIPLEDPWAPREIVSPALVEWLEQPATAIAAGWWHSCAQVDASTISCWGQLPTGPNSWNTFVIPKDTSVDGTIVAIGAGEDLTCALLDSQSVECWGIGDSGALGLPSEDTSLEPVRVDSIAGQVGSLSVGRRHACASLLDGSVACWGDNSLGQIGLDSAVAGTQAIGPVVVREAVDVVATGTGHTCVAESELVTCWGDNRAGQVLPDGEHAAHVTGQLQLDGVVTGLALGFQYSCALLTDRVLCWGLAHHPAGPKLRELEFPGGVPTRIVGGATHACALGMAGETWCWGYDFVGQVGDGGEPVQLVESPVRVDVGPFVELAAGQVHTCGLAETGAVYCWGGNFYRQAGQI
jgi:alpha-tubulin suppressor-like RCC1 family protein